MILDETDRQLITLLRSDGRRSNRSLASVLAVSEVTVAARIRAMEEARVLRVIAQIDFEESGHAYLVAAKIRVRANVLRTVGSAISRIPEVIGVGQVAGRYDFLAILLARDREQLNELVVEGLSTIPGVDEVRTEVGLEVLRYLPEYALLSANSPPLDLTMLGLLVPLDLAIVSALQSDGRQSNRRVAAQLSISEGTVRARIKRMTDDGLLRIAAVADFATLGVGGSAYVGVHTAGSSTQAVASAIADMPEISWAMRSLGDYQVFALAVTPDRRSLFDLILGRIASLPGVARTETMEGVAVYKHSYGWARYLSKP